MSETQCGKCFANAHFVEIGHDEDKGTFKLYRCDDCGGLTRVFTAPPTREVDAEVQIRLWPHEPGWKNWD